MKCMSAAIAAAAVAAACHMNCLSAAAAAVAAACHIDCMSAAAKQQQHQQDVLHSVNGEADPF
jgi:hypothetical protein